MRIKKEGHGIKADGADPNAHVKQFINLLIAASSEVKVGVKGLFDTKQNGYGRRDPPNFGKYMNRKMFECLMSCFCYLWADKKYWFQDNRHLPWDVFMPCLKSMNEKRKKLFVDIVMALYDEPMSGWCPKTSKYGGLPNYTYEPRKPVPLGTMLRNCGCPQTGVLPYQGIVMMPEKQRCKTFGLEDAVLPSKKVRPQPTAGVLRQALGAGVKKGGWVGGDAWFGSVTSAVETLHLLGIYSTWIVKRYTHLFPVAQLFDVLMARYSKGVGGIAGKWVVMTADIPCAEASDPRDPSKVVPANTIRVIAMAYAWSRRGVSYFVSTCGKTTTCDDPYLSHYEDEYGSVCSKKLCRPWMADFLFKKLPIIDGHNKLRQKMLALERCWPTKCCWTRAVVTLLGQCVVDFFYAMQYLQSETYGDMTILEFADVLVGKLQGAPGWDKGSAEGRGSGTASGGRVVRTSKRKAAPKPRQSASSPKKKKLTSQVNCWVCRKYQKKGRLTTWRCKKCNVPLCLVQRTTPEGRPSCIDEHARACSDSAVGCKEGEWYTQGKFPKTGRHWGWK